MQCSTAQYSTVQYSTKQYSAVQYNTVQNNTVVNYTSECPLERSRADRLPPAFPPTGASYDTRPCFVRHSPRSVAFPGLCRPTRPPNPAQHSTAQYRTVQYSTMQYRTVQYSTVQHTTVQYSTGQYSTGQYRERGRERQRGRERRSCFVQWGFNTRLTHRTCNLQQIAACMLLRTTSYD